MGDRSVDERPWSVRRTRLPRREPVLGRVRRRLRRGARRGKGPSEWLDLVDVPILGDSFAVVAVVLTVVVLILASIAFGPLLLALAVSIIELVVIGTAGLSAGCWAWFRRRPHHLVAEHGDGERWARLAGDDDGSLDLVQLNAGIAPDRLGYQRVA